MFNTTVENKDALKKLKKLSKTAFPGAVRNSLNGMARGAGIYARSKTLKRFHIRNKWTKGSIIPATGKNFGLIPKNKTNINKMFSEMGSRQEYLRDQEGGFRKRTPAIPVYRSARKGGSFSGRLKPSLRMSKMKNIRTYRDMPNKATTTKGKTFAMLSMSSRNGYRGMFFLNVPGTYKRGLWKIKRKAKKASRVPSMTFIRSQEKGSKSYKKKPWMAPVVNKFQQQKTYDFYWNKEVKRMIDPVFKKAN